MDLRNTVNLTKKIFNLTLYDYKYNPICIKQSLLTFYKCTLKIFKDKNLIKTFIISFVRRYVIAIKPFANS